MGINLYFIVPIQNGIQNFTWLREAKANEKEQEIYHTLLKSLNTEAIISINYTSGTLGEPTGILMTHKNIITDTFFAIRFLPIFPEDRF
ncbi:MAG: AMP-binding protein [Candidatus Marinimicrobia bacterium]|nr:AMP-binding protein [Candidatus Neomarinimicrobiota bacterium]MDD5581715.1 AMP-binding protein [Candidatus Neomarinimicrobiota bacterium]